MHLHYVFSIYDAMKQNIYTISSIVKLALLVTFVLVAVIFTGCTKGPEVEAEEPYLNIRSELYPFDASGGKDLLVFSTNTPWEAKIETPETAAPADAWCGVTPSSGEAGENLRLQVTVGENDTYSERGVFLVLRAGTREERIAVRQRQKNTILSGQNDYAVSCEEQTLTVEVQANVAYETVVESGQQWIKEAEAPADTKALETTAHVFRIAANAEERERRGVVLFRSTETKLCDTLTVIQEAWVDPAPELTALTALYESTGGDGWTHNDNWCSDKPLNEWYGVETDEEGYVISLKLADNNLSGTLPEQVADLSRLSHIDFSRNALGGNLPEWKTMGKVRYMNLSYNHFEGYIPDWSVLFENGRSVEIVLNNNKLYGWPESFMQYHEPGRLCMAGIRQYYDGKHTFFLDGLSVPDFTICDLVSGGEVSVRDIYSRNKLTMLLAWNPLQEESVRFMETTVKRLYTLFHTQGFDVIAVTPEGDAYRTAAQVYVQEHDVPWYVCTDYHDADGERFVLPSDPYPSYLLCKQDGALVADMFVGGRAPHFFESLGERETFEDMLSFQHASELNTIVCDVFGQSEYESTDFSMDKQYEILQRATRGNGIGIALIGEAFTDVDIATGWYRQMMEFAMESFFAIEPTKSYREYFDVYMVYAVSKKDHIATSIMAGDTETALGLTGSNNDDLDIIHSSRIYIPQKYGSISPELSSVDVWSAMVNNIYAGMTHTYISNTGYVERPSCAFTGCIQDRLYMRGIFIHETIGHAFGWLAEEYGNSALLPSQKIPEYKKLSLIENQQKSRFSLNVSVSNDPATVSWAHLINHPQFPYVSVYEGGAGYNLGVWRSENQSIMRTSTTLYFAAICRELIVKRILELSGESYTFEKFLEKDSDEGRMF